MMIELTAILGFFVLVTNVIAIVGIGRSNAEMQLKVVWILAVLLFPLLGFVAWLFAGPRSLPATKDLLKPGQA